MNNLKISLESGDFSDASKKDDSIKTIAGTPWRVRGGNFGFRFTCVFAISNYNMNNDKDKDVRVPAKKDDPVAEDDIYANPMHISDKISSFLTVTIKPEDEAVGMVDHILDLYKPLPVIKAVPKALWRQYNKLNDPQYTKNPTDLLDGNDSVVNLAIGLSISTPHPQISYNTIPALHAADAMSQNVSRNQSPRSDAKRPEAHERSRHQPDPARFRDCADIVQAAPIDGKTDQEK